MFKGIYLIYSSRFPEKQAHKYNGSVELRVDSKRDELSKSSAESGAKDTLFKNTLENVASPSNC